MKISPIVSEAEMHSFNFQENRLLIQLKIINFLGGDDEYLKSVNC